MATQTRRTYLPPTTFVAMGQPVAVVEKQSAIPGLVRFEANRTLTGMGHERFSEPDQAVGPRPAAELARRLFDTGQIDLVHIYGNIVTVELKEGSDANGLKDIVENLYIYCLLYTSDAADEL